MSVIVASHSQPASTAEPVVVELASIGSRELEPFWRVELETWRERLDWDVTSALASLRRAVERGSILGRAVRQGRFIVAYSYYLVEGRRGVVSAFHVASSASPRDRKDLARRLLPAVVRDLEVRGARRIETQLVSADSTALVSCFEDEGFRTHWRRFSRLRLPRHRNGGFGSHEDAPAASPKNLTLLPFRAWNLSELSALMCRAHEGGCDAAMNELYRTRAGCRVLLENVVRQRGCGPPVQHASSVARIRGADRAVGFALVTETAKRRAHLAQLAVSPLYQRSGVGRALIAHAVDGLASRGFDTLSLMVSDGNDRAAGLYRSFGFETELRFPVFSR